MGFIFSLTKIYATAQKPTISLIGLFKNAEISVNTGNGVIVREVSITVVADEGRW